MSISKAIGSKFLTASKKLWGVNRGPAIVLDHIPYFLGKAVSDMCDSNLVQPVVPGITREDSNSVAGTTIC